MVYLARMLLQAAGELAASPLAEPAAAPDAGDECTGGGEEDTCSYGTDVTTLRIIAIVVILFAGAVGMFVPEAIRRFGVQRDHPAFFIVKAFGAGVILATGFLHMFPTAVASFDNPCLNWKGYQWAGAITSVTVIAVQAFEMFVGKFVEKKIRKDVKTKAAINKEKAPHDLAAQDPEKQEAEIARASADLATMHVHGHTHPEGEHGHEHDNTILDASVRHESIALVLETGIAMHSVLIGIALGVLKSPCVIVPLLIALTFHQMFEGFALGTCLVQAQYTVWAYTGMGVFFAAMTPTGVGIGIGIQENYNENSAASLGVNGVFDSISAGILIYMALVDILAVDFRTRQFLSSHSLQFGGYLAVLLGAGVMLILGIWA